MQVGYPEMTLTREKTVNRRSADGMTPTATDTAVLVPIDEVARRFGVHASAIRYYEQRGLLNPVSRHAGRRWYGPTELRRLAVIRYWQESALMRLDDIGAILAGTQDPDRWRELIDRHLQTLAERIERMETAKEFLAHVRSYHDTAPDGCAHYEALLWERTAEGSGAADANAEGHPMNEDHPMKGP
jgi:DNA-binding transcriptional MerR regulator